MTAAVPADPPADPAQRTALKGAIAALQAQRTVLGDAVVDAALAPLRQRLAAGTPARPVARPVAQAAAQAAAQAPAQAPAPQPEQAAAEPTRRLRQVSVLFLDVVGSTTLSEHLDPEDVQAVMDTAMSAFTAVVDTHGGRVLQYAGDSLLAAFGVDAVHEDDAERAVLAGLALLQQARAQAESVQRRFGRSGFDVRVGIHSGSALMGGGVDGDGTIRGHTVNLAARMEQTAPAGALRISQDTWALVRGAFEAEAQAPLMVKGHDEPVATWLVKAARPRALRLPGRGIAGVETPLAGRLHELQCFDATVLALLADRQPRTVTLLAEAGLGKSRLLREFQHRLSGLNSKWWMLPARAQPSGSLQPYGLLRDLLLRRLEIADSDSADTARAKFVQAMAPWLTQPHDPAPELLGQLIGLDFSAAPAVIRLGADTRLLLDRALTALRLWLQRLAASDGSPVVLLLDDLHWADDASLDALSKLLKNLQGPVLALLGARPGLLERRADWGEALPRHERLVLAPLDAKHGAALAHSLLQRLGAVPPALAALIEQRAGGNPFYAEELVMLLIDQGVIERRSDSGAETATVTDTDTEWTFHAEHVMPQQLPATLTAVLQARIDALDSGERRALQMASVIGPVFWDDALAALDVHGPDALPALQKKALVQRRPVSAIEHTAEEAFEHHLLHQVSYGTVLKPDKIQAHARAASWLTERVGGRSDEYLAITAQHHERAGQHALAADCYDRAAKKASDRSAFKAVLQYADSAEEKLALAGELWPPERFLWSAKRRIAACDSLALRDRQAQEIHRLMKAGEEQSRPQWVAQALTSLTLLSFWLGRLEEAQATASRGAELAQAADEPALGALCQGNLAWMAMERQDTDVAQAHLDAAMALAVQAREQLRSPNDGIYEVQLLLVQAEVHKLRNNLTARTASVGRALALSSQLNEPRLQCSCHEHAAKDALTRADEEDAAHHVDAAERLAAEFGLPLAMANAQGERASLHLQCGRWDDAARESTAATQKYVAMANAAGAQRSRAVAAEALWRGGHVVEAVALWQENAAIQAGRADDVAARCTRLRLAEARAASDRAEDLDAALQAVRAELPAMAKAEPLSTAAFPLAARLAAWRVLHRAGDPQAPAQRALAEAELQHVLDGFDDPAVRQRVTHGVPWHRDVLEAGAQADATSLPGAGVRHVLAPGPRPR